MEYSYSGSTLWLLPFLIATVVIQTGEAWDTYVDRVERAMPTAQPENPVTVNLTEEISEEVDHHLYYRATYRDHDSNPWMDVESLGVNLTINDRLSTSDRHAVRVGLDFSFPFYGYNISFLHITTSGFLYVGNYPHRLLAETQYVAPLMADFTPQLDSRSKVSYFKNGSMFIAEWKDVHLQMDQDKNFTFQVAIYKNGTFLFSYKELQIPVEDILTDDTSPHPVKVGLADAYYVDTPLLYGLFTRRTIYEYHSVELNFTKVQSSSSILLEPLESCTARTTCAACTTDPPEGFDCTWCEAAQKCSDGFDRHRQVWVNSNCPDRNTTTCPTPGPTRETTGGTTVRTTVLPPTSKAPPEDICPKLDCGKGHCNDNKCVCPEGYHGGACQASGGGGGGSSSAQQGGSSKAGLVVFLLVLIITIVVAATWVGYAYRNPTTESGLTLIRITRCYYCKGSREAGGTYKYSRTGESI